MVAPPNNVGDEIGTKGVHESQEYSFVSWDQL